MDELVAFLGENGFTTDQQEAIGRQFHRRELKKGDLFLQEGQISQQLGFVEKGLFHYFCNRNGDEITSYTAGPGDFLVSLSSFLRQRPARETIRALTDSVVWAIHKRGFDQLRRDAPPFEAFYVGVLEEQIVCIEDSRFNLLTLTAEERYQKLLEEEPNLLQEVPLQYLASILGVTPRHLSRIRGHIR
ncbi:putative transcriptional regulator, Crp/Fnr family [Fibrisoma limi BUZ 3]|uniref:Putative transcriptional regulator, Crp/Fnr family n=1 Tax=Fibrisoma limi BUZ 3 TaxID=1185876 RepID=I2GLB1_9BACT|nr:Crp/Fnr family transcriptional regulator [Fibrisoma limi]CCH54687.1 putative transcriptional regulator, Crp/Fnr family [Fibrisoma limi BUZ 3]